MAVAQVQFHLAQQSTTGNQTNTLATAPTQGNLLLATEFYQGTFTSVGPGWTLLDNATGPTCGIAIAWKFAGASEPVAQTPFVIATTYGTSAVAEYSGTDPVTPISPGSHTTGFTASQSLNPALTLGPVAVQVAGSYGVSSCVAQATTGGTCGNAPGWSNWTSNYSRFGGVWNYKTNPALPTISASFTFVSGTTAQYAMGYAVIINAPLPVTTTLSSGGGGTVAEFKHDEPAADPNEWAWQAFQVISGADYEYKRFAPANEIPHDVPHGKRTASGLAAFFEQSKLRDAPTVPERKGRG